MSEVTLNKKDKLIDSNNYLRDNLHLASQSKVRSDSMSQTSVSRGKPLIMFSGSSEVKGKTTMLSKLFTNESFNICSSKSNPIHKTSVDLVYLSSKQNVNYHILDIHGKINNPYYQYCTNTRASRMDCLVSLSSLCHCVVIQITQNQLRGSSKVKKFLNNFKKPKEKFTIESLISNKAKDVTLFYQKIKVSYTINFGPFFVFCLFYCVKHEKRETQQRKKKTTKQNIIGDGELACRVGYP